MSAATSGQRNVQVVQTLYDAYGSRDVPALLGVLADDIEVRVTESLPWGGRFTGRDGMMEFIQKITSHIDSGVVVEEMIEADDHIIVLGRSQGTIIATGKEYEVRLIDIVELQDGKVRRLDIFIDTPAMHQLLAG